jgi:hypothetical protein
MIKTYLVMNGYGDLVVYVFISLVLVLLRSLACLIRYLALKLVKPVKRTWKMIKTCSTNDTEKNFAI